MIAGYASAYHDVSFNEYIRASAHDRAPNPRPLP
jgi:hypothetical protein